MDENSDPDLYVSNKPGVCKTDYNWKATSIGAVELSIHPIDEDYTKESYYVAIYGAREELNSFGMCVTLSDPSNIRSFQRMNEHNLSANPNIGKRRKSN